MFGKVLRGTFIASMILLHAAAGGAQECTDDSPLRKLGVGVQAAATATIGTGVEATGTATIGSGVESAGTFKAPVPPPIPAISCMQGFGTIPLPAAEKIIEHAGAGSDAKLTTIPVVYYSGNAVARIPVYRLQTPDRIVWIDGSGRVYSTWDDWKQNSGLPEGSIVAPIYGTLYGPGCSGPVERFDSAAGDLGHKLAGVVDGAAAVAGVALAGAAVVVVVAGTGGTALIVGGAVLGGYGAIHATTVLNDRQQHEQTLDPNDPGARAAWLQLASSSLGAASAGAGAGLGSAQAANGLATSSLLLNAAGLGDTAVQAAQNWGSMSDQERQNVALGLVFGGVTLVGGAIDPASGKPVFVPVH